MKRRRILGSIGALGLGIAGSGCQERPDARSVPSSDRTVDSTDRPGNSVTDTEDSDGLPEECPVDTLEGYEPPTDLTLSEATDFATEYELDYLAQDPDFGSANWTIEGTREVQGGYVVVIWMRWSIIGDGTYVVYADPDPGVVPEDVDPVPVEELQVPELASLAREAAETNRREPLVVGEELPDEVASELESLPEGSDGRFVAVDGQPIVLELSRNTVIGDGEGTASYYIGDGIVRRSFAYPSEEADRPRDGELVERG